MVTEEQQNSDEDMFLATQVVDTSASNTWLIDSSCTSHMSKHLSMFSSLNNGIQPKVKLGNCEVVTAKGKGTIAINTKRGINTMFDFYIP